MEYTFRKSIVFLADDGAEVLAHPFFYTDQSGSGIKVELFTNDGVRLRCVDETKGVYSFGESGKVVHLMSSATRPAAS